MPRDIGSMTDHELLEELVLQGRRAERANTIKTCVIAGLLLVIIILALVYIPKIMAPIRQLSGSMDEIRSTAEQVKSVLENFDQETIDKFKQSMESFGETSQQARVFLEKLKESGIENFASTIEELNKAIDGLVKFFRR